MDLKKIRIELNLNQAQMARALGIHRQTWVKWERAEQRPPAVLIQFLKTLRWLDAKNMLPAYLNSLAH